MRWKMGRMPFCKSAFRVNKAAKVTIAAYARGRSSTCINKAEAGME